MKNQTLLAQRMSRLSKNRNTLAANGGLSNGDVQNPEKLQGNAGSTVTKTAAQN
jgi:hypothetical protein